jgi:hypothetical protein
MLYIGIDNGVTGGIAILFPGGSILNAKTPVKRVLNYTKEKQWMNRIVFNELGQLLRGGQSRTTLMNSFCLIERPMVNPERFKATVSALRALEATEIILERSMIPYQFIDSKEWQKALLPKGLKGPDELKKAAKYVAKQLFPNVKIVNADSLLIAEYCRRTYKR